MFKVPEWGNDIPKHNEDVAKVFTKKNLKKQDRNTKNINPSVKVNRTNNVINKKKKLNVNSVSNAKNRFVQKTNSILSKDDHIKNRMLKRSLKNGIVPETNSQNNVKEENNNRNRPSLTSIIDVSNQIKNKILKRKGKTNKNKVNSVNNKARKSEFGNHVKGIANDNSNSVKNKNSRKRKHAQKNSVTKGTMDENIHIQNYNTDEPDKILVNAKRKKLNDKFKNDDIEDLLFGNNSQVDNTKTNSKKVKSNDELCTNPDSQVVLPAKERKIQKKKEQLKNMLTKRDSNRNIIHTSGDKLRMRMMERLKAAQFRYLNEKLYTSSGSESQELFKSDPAAFQTYHEGYQQQVKKWPVNPLDLIVTRIQKMPKTHLIADMGCGEAALSKRVPNTVRSFDLVATAPGVEACNMAHTPLLTASMDVVVYCLALMGTDLTQYLLEANRVLKIGGHLLIAEVESRFENAETFSSDVQRLGFSLKKMDKTHKVFFFMEFSKVRDAPAKKHKLPVLSLKPCLYKKR